MERACSVIRLDWPGEGLCQHQGQQPRAFGKKKKQQHHCSPTKCSPGVKHRQKLSQQLWAWGRWWLFSRAGHFAPGDHSREQPYIEGDQHVLACSPGTSFSEESPREFFPPAEMPA